MQTESIRARRGGIQWHVQVHGKSDDATVPTLLLLHGTGSSSDSFGALIPLLADRFRIIAPDLPGHARSSVTQSSSFEPSLRSMAAALEGLLTELAVSPSIMVGHSAGAAVLARLTLDRRGGRGGGGLAGAGARRDPELLVGLGAALAPFRSAVAKVVFRPAAKILACVSKVSPLLLRARHRGTVERIIERTGSSLDDAGVERYRQLASNGDHVAGTLAMMAAWDVEALYTDLPNLDVPFLLLAGEHDRAASPLEQQKVSRRVNVNVNVNRRAAATVKIVAGAGHLLHEEKPSVVAQLITDEYGRIREENRSSLPAVPELHTHIHVNESKEGQLVNDDESN